MDDKSFNGFDQNSGSGSGDDFSGFLGGDSLGSYDESSIGGNNDYSTGSSFGGNNDYNSGSSFGSNNDYSTGSSFGGNNDFNSGSSFGSNNDYSTGSSFGGNNDYSTGSSIGGNNDFNSGSSFGGNNDYSTGSSFGSNNDYSTGSSIGGNNDYSTGSSFGGNNDYNSDSSFGNQGLNNNPQDNYDPNAMFSDPSSNLFGGQNSYSPASFNNAPTVSVKTSTGNKTGVIIAILMLLVAAVVATIVIINNNKKVTFREWSQTDEGRAFISKMQSVANTDYDTADYTVKISVRDDDKLVMALKMKVYQEVTPEQMEIVKEYTDKALASQKKSLASDIKRIKEKAKLQDFSVVYEMINANGDFMFDIIVTENDLNS